ncbi:hypothetical protein KQ939_13810 [Planococcus sp. CP5-4]|uniref:hypothetical protein n=1 Tax=unclassified Planococcus (in: firmicutes) TaxID=2662419 RepID=UPI001C23EDF5|nr:MULTISPECIES: hypothetical protein [unclassified Planococcus (in: firmicutes)]MBU9674010.1 hypothetical protein [Planococcus sp. CP5-4_YE]MBV0909881.1 hypothetical protein [Planococcus sp. CP5-4_UN]MBW6064761.1 hypothetical protein [Planococcus sp. CP5-4]
MNKRVKNTLIGTLMYGVIAYIVTYILDGQPVWNLVIGMALAGFLSYGFILPYMEKKRVEKNNKRTGET